ncbi:hypothetical protein EHI45_13510 [Rhizobium leguminosarum]|uniref:hypothetical protein n=1 Tax=Rhizobium leguminosarum TaxID=384 RepID=UPI000FEC5E97|nr:hypothetical protein [Rhizobium leguminosarum]RWX14299.1 hypothetical protein EHI45_13510 [Rhizobium leguminosarum]
MDIKSAISRSTILILSFWILEMNIYAIEIVLKGNAHIKATSHEQAERILDNNCSNTIHGQDEEWFSNAPSRYRTRASLSTKFTVTGPVVAATFIEVPRRTVRAAQDRWGRYWHGLRWAYPPLSREHEQVPVYSTSLDLTTTAFVRAIRIDAAEAVVAKFTQLTLDLLDDNSRWFSSRALGDEGGSDLPIVLSSALYLVGKSEGCQLSQVWPDGPYLGTEFVARIDGFL